MTARKWRWVVGILATVMVAFTLACSGGGNSGSGTNHTAKATATATVTKTATKTPPVTVSLPRSINDGGTTKTWTKGKIRPGIWIAINPTRNCSFVAVQADGNKLTGDVDVATQGIQVLPTDKKFVSTACNKWVWSNTG